MIQDDYLTDADRVSKLFAIRNKKNNENNRRKNDEEKSEEGYQIFCSDNMLEDIGEYYEKMRLQKQKNKRRYVSKLER